MYYKFITKELLFQILTDINVDLQTALISIPYSIWDMFFLGVPKQYDKFISEVKEEREKKEKEQRLAAIKGGIRSVAFTPPHTTVIWDDGMITRITCEANKVYSKEQELLNCIVKRAYGNSEKFTNTLKYWIENGWSSDNVESVQQENDNKEIPKISNPTQTQDTPDLPPSVSDIEDVLMEAEAGNHRYFHLTNEKDIYILANKIVRHAYAYTGDIAKNDVWWKKGDELFLQALLLYIYQYYKPQDRTVYNLIQLIRKAGEDENEESSKSKLDRRFANMEKEFPDHPAVKKYKDFQSGYGHRAKSFIFLTAMNVAKYVKEKESFMARICPATKELVLYTACAECEEKQCRSGNENEKEKSEKRK